MDFTLSLAHFCEVHGPTSILCTQLSPIDCATCFPCPTPPSEDISRDSSYGSSTAALYESPASVGGVLHTLSAHNAPLLSPFDSPPTSPRGSTSHNPYFPDDNAPLRPPRSHSARSSVSRFSVGSDSDTESCDNCMFLVPKAMSERLPDGAPGSPIKDGKGHHGSPVLRTTQSITARGAPAEFFESRNTRERSTSRRREASTPTEEDDLANPLTAASTPSTLSTDSAPTFSPYYSSTSSTHTHTLTYVTTKQPLSQASYSFLRRACIRTLSNETLPKGSPSGPLFFGDPHAGYTIAYVFRVPDPRARGKRRMYALLALGGRDSWRVSKVYVMLTKVFESIASQIIGMADKVIERDFAPTPTSPLLDLGALSSSLPSTITTTTQNSSSNHHELRSPEAAAGPGKDGRVIKSATTSPTMKNARFNNTSSFLTGKRVDPDGHPRMPHEVMKAKGLAEIVGKDNFFVELHARFCVVLSTLLKESAR